MIAHPRPYPIAIPVYKALLRRLNPSHPKFELMRDHLRRSISGHKGEEKLDFHLAALDEERYILLHGLRIPLGDYFFQMDTLLLSTNFILILDAKNYSGNIFLDTKANQLVQETKGQIYTYKCPVLQAQRQSLDLKKWLMLQKSPPIPIDYLVVFTNEYCHLSVDNDSVFQKVCKSADLYNRVEKLDNQYQKRKLTQSNLQKLIATLIQTHTPKSSFEILSEHQLTKEDISSGVQCPSCDQIPMIYFRGKWYCPTCKHQSRDAHLNAIQDFFLLIKPSISNSQLRAFLHLPHEKAAQRMLQSLHNKGKTKARIYYQN